MPHRAVLDLSGPLVALIDLEVQLLLDLGEILEDPLHLVQQLRRDRFFAIRSG